MCGRFTLQIPPEMLAEIFGLMEIPVYPFRYNIAPTQQIPVIRQNGQNHLEFLRWGLIPSWAKDHAVGNRMITARSETVAEKPAFRTAIKYKRCLIPSSGFYEWVKEGDTKRPIYIHLKDDPLMVFAGIWEQWKSPEGGIIESCSILTTHSNKLIEPIHDRQPVILHPEEFNLWLDRNMTDPEKLKRFYQTYPSERMGMYQVSPQVNNPRNDFSDLIRP